MTVLQTTAMIELVPESLTEISSQKTFLREVKLDSLRSRQENADMDRYGFWSKVLKKEKPRRDVNVNRIARLKIELGGWVNLPPNLHCAVSLLLEYEDAKGKHSCVLDQMNARGATQVLLAGSADLQVHGKVRKMELFCGGVNDRSVWIDNMHIKTSEIDTAYLEAAS